MKKGWQTRRLGDVVTRLTNGYVGPTRNIYLESGVPYLLARHVRSNNLLFDGRTFISDEFNQKNKKSMLKAGDVLLVQSGHIGHSAVVTEEHEGHNCHAMIVISPIKEAVTGPFLSLFFNSPDMQRSFEEIRSGSTVPHLTCGAVKELQIPVPPLAEQQRIVGLVDEAFAGLATAKANAEKNLQNARALFESHLQSVFTQRGLGWKATTLGEEIDLLAGFAFKSKQYTAKEDDIRLLRGDNIVQGCLRWDDVKRWPANDTKEYERYWLRAGDVVLAMDRPWVKAGLKHATIASDDLPCLLVQRTARLRGGTNLDTRFLKLLIGSSSFTSHILGVQTGIGVPHISGQQIKDFEFARPPLTEQRRIADNLESLREETQRLASLYERKLAALEALKKSLLHQAFAGEL